MKMIALFAVAASLAFFGSSCETTTPSPPDNGDGHHHGHDDDDDHQDHQPLPRMSWDLRPAGSGYDLDLLFGREDVHVATGGEYLRGRGVSRNSRNVPRGTASAFEVLLPDGEIDLYWVEEGRPGTLLIYRKSYDAYEDRWSSERRLRMVEF